MIKVVFFYLQLLLFFSAERQAQINVAEGKKTSVMLEAQGKLGYKIRILNLDLLDRYGQPHVNCMPYNLYM